MTDTPDPVATKPDLATPTEEQHSPLHREHLAAGASFTDFAGWLMPVRYDSDLAEHHAVRTHAGLFDLSHMGEILILGPEASDALDYALAGKLSAIAVGQAKYSLLLSRDGGIIDDLVVYRTGVDRYLVVANASNRAVVAAELLDRCSPFECEVQDESDDIALIAIQGPRALEILREVPGIGVPGLDDLKYYWCAAGEFHDNALLVARTGYTGEDGFELYLAPEAAPALWDALLETGAGSGLVPAGLASRDTLRLEAGMPLYGHELGLDVSPAQAGLGRVVNLKKEGMFVGREAVEQALADTASVAPRVLVGLHSEGKRAGRAGYELFAAGTATTAGAATETAADTAADTDTATATATAVDPEAAAAPIGTITSGALSPTLGFPIAMAYIDPAFATAGTELFIDVRGTRVRASVVALPFYQREAN